MDQTANTQGAAHGLADGYGTWKQDMDDYIYKKTNFTGVMPEYKKVTNAFVKSQEVLYNPITQQYTNGQKENQIKQFEQQNMSDVLAQNKDRALRYEQTYNILNFENKMQGLEKRPDYPKEKPWYFRPGKDTQVDYNIISNVHMQEHHFAAPEKRPPPDPPVLVRGKKIDLPALREYNVVTNRYLEYHDEKEQANNDIQRLEAAQAFWNTHDFDPLNAQYFDKEKEVDFCSTRAENALVHGKDQVKKLPLTVQNDGLMYNPVNMVIEDEARLADRDVREKNKKKRYEVRYDAETVTRKEMLAEQDRLDAMKLNKVSYQRVAEQLGRGFDILSNGANDDELGRVNQAAYMNKETSAWDRLSPKAESAAKEDGTVNNSNFEFTSTNFQSRSRRLNTNLASQAPEAEAEKAESNAVGSASQHSAKKSVPCVPSSHHSQKPPQVPASHHSSKKATEMSSHASAMNPSLNDRAVSHASQNPSIPGSAHQSHQASVPRSVRSNASGSVRAIRSGGFAKLGAALVASEKGSHKA